MARQDWQAIWADQKIDLEKDKARLHDEMNTIRWREMQKTIEHNLGKLEGLKSIEVGAGLGDFSIILNWQGVNTCLSDYSDEAIKKAEARFMAHGLTAEYVQADMLNVPAELKDKFDISFSLGLGEHFENEDRTKIIAAHADVLKQGGLTFISLPYRFSPAYRLWMKKMIKNNSWPYGLEIPFSKREIKRLAEKSGLETIGFIQSSFFADWDRFFPAHRVGKVFRNKLEQKSVFDNLGYALVYVGKKK